MLAMSGCNKKVIADFDCPKSAYVDEMISITNLSVNAYSYHWKINDVYINHTEIGDLISNYSYDSYEPPLISFNFSGKKKISLTVWSKNGNKNSEMIKYITILEKPIDDSGNDNNSQPVASPTASFNINSSNGNYAPTTIQCNNTSTNAITYKWTLTKPDYSSVTSTLKNPSFTCSQAGTYTLELIAYNSNNVSSTKSQTFTLVTPSTYTITYLKLQQIPMLASDNSSWDTGVMSGADPDIFFTIVNSNGAVLYSSTINNNVSESSLPITWSNVNTTLEYSSNYNIKFYDSDDGIDSNDLMSNCILNSSNLTPGNNSYTWINTNISMKFTIGLSW